MIKLNKLFCIATLLFTIVFWPNSFLTQTSACMALKSTKVTTPNLIIGEIDKCIGVDQKSYALKLQINLPANWSDQNLFHVGRELNGSVGEIG